MEKSYLITVVNAKDGKPHSQVKLPFLPRVGDDVIIEDTNLTILKVTIQATNIQVAIPNEPMIIPGRPKQSTDPELLIPVIIFAEINTLQQDNKSSKKGSPANENTEKKIIQ